MTDREARIALYAARAEAGLRLFDGQGRNREDVEMPAIIDLPTTENRGGCNPSKKKALITGYKWRICPRCKSAATFTLPGVRLRYWRRCSACRRIYNTSQEALRWMASHEPKVKKR